MSQVQQVVAPQGFERMSSAQLHSAVNPEQECCHVQLIQYFPSDIRLT